MLKIFQNLPFAALAARSAREVLQGGRGVPGVLGLALALVIATPALAVEPLLVDAAWLQAHLGDRDLRIVDMATDRETYQQGHIPGAVHLSVDEARTEVPGAGYRVPTAEEAARLFGRLGLTPETRVVIYDDSGGVHAAWLFFTLDAFGHRRAALLDGGLQTWRRAGLPLSAETSRVAPTTYPVPAGPDHVVTAGWILAHLNDPGVVLVDSRSADEFAGRDVRAQRGGHIPGAVNIDWREHLAPDGRFKPVETLRQLYASRGVTPDRTVVTYCQTHHRAAHAYFVLRLLGYPRLLGYDRSWAEWGNRLDLPIAR